MAESRAGRPLHLAVSGASVARRDGVWRTYHSFGQILDQLARRVAEVRYHAPLATDEATCDYPLTAPNLHVEPWAAWGNSLGAMKRPWRLVRGYWRLSGDGDAILLRGSGPLNWLVHLFARLRGRRVVHWLVGNPLAIIAGSDRGYGGPVRLLGTIFARFERVMLRLSARVSRATLLVNGQELARIYRSNRTITVVSTSITAGDLRRREDTCSGDEIRLLYMGFIRPEKGVEHLIEALPLVHSSRPVRLVVVGSVGPFGDYAGRLRRLADRLGVADRIDWAGHVPFGPGRFKYMDEADIFVLPTLSEGTPRVLVEARARCLPVVSTGVGGIPSSVTDGVDGLLVPPANPASLAAAVGRVIGDGDLRRGLIRAGYERVATLTVERFAETLVSVLGGASPQFGDPARRDAVP